MDGSKLEGELQKLDKRMGKLRTRRANIESRYLDACARPKLRKLVGKCFKYRNSYGSGESWWMYARVISFDERAMNFKAAEFQKTSRDCIQIECESVHIFNGCNRFGVESGWIPISLNEYKREARSIQKFVTGLLG